MTVKNFLKTAVLGIAFCSVIDIASSDLGDKYVGNNLNRILDVLYQQMNNDNQQMRANDETVQNHLRIIMNIIQRALNGKINEQNIQTFNRKVDEVVHLTKNYQSRYRDAIYTLVMNRDNIIAAMRETLKITYNLYPKNRNNGGHHDPDDPDGSVKVRAEDKEKSDLSLSNNFSSCSMKTNYSDNNEDIEYEIELAN